jgi:hypothetical protein
MIRLLNGKVVSPGDWKAITAQSEETTKVRNTYSEPFVSFWVLATHPDHGKVILSHREVYYARNGIASLVGAPADAPRLLGPNSNDVGVYARGAIAIGGLLLLVVVASQAAPAAAIPVGVGALWFAFGARFF